MAGEFVVKTEGGKRQLIINYKGSPYGADIAQYPQCMQDVVNKLREVDADEIVLSEYYEKIYNSEQTRLLKGIADLVTKFESEAVWAPSNLSAGKDSKVLAARHDAVMQFLSLLQADFFKSYLFLMQEIKQQNAKAEQMTDAERDDLEIYLKTLDFLRGEIERTEAIQRMKKYLLQLSEIPADRGIYHAFFESAIKPSFIGSRIFFTGVESLQLADQYEVAGTKVYIYKHPEKVEYLYYINPPEYTLPPDQYFLLEKTKEVVSTHRPSSVSFLDMQQARRYFRKIYTATIGDLALHNQIKISAQEKDDLANIVARYTIGYGILEILLSDRQITDVYIDSPLGEKAIYLVHSKYGQCQTNIIFSEDEAKSTVSRFRALSGRPFDEAHPILDFDLPDLQTRIAAIGRPLALDGTAFAFRLHKETPWTLAQFLDQKMFSSFSAGLLSFFVDAQASSLIVGSRGAGKTSLLQAMMQEIPQNLRIIVQEDSVTGDSELLVQRDGKLEKTTAGKLIDGLLEKYGCMEANGKEFVGAVEDVQVFSVNRQGKIVLSKVSQFIRSKPEKDIYSVETKGGKRIKVTQDHSLFFGDGRELVAARTASLKVGEKIAVAEIVENAGANQKTVRIALAFEEVKSITNLGRTGEYVYDFSVPDCENFVCENIIAHNTQELPVPQLKKLGFNIQRLKTRPPLGAQSEAEVSAEDALRTALRLGDSVLIVGEVRSTESRALYEAMRVGAVGNVVMGTIHGESAYSIWDRVVNDLGVPTTSFKATDFAIVAAPIRFKGSLKRSRRLTEITEVKKHWTEDPEKEGGLMTWMQFDANKDDMQVFDDNIAASEWLEKLERNRGLKREEIWAEIRARAESKQYLVDLRRKYDLPKLLEAENSIKAHTKFMLMEEQQREERGAVEHKELLRDWKQWVDDSLAKPLMKK